MEDPADVEAEPEAEAGPSSGGRKGGSGKRKRPAKEGKKGTIFPTHNKKVQKYKTALNLWKKFREQTGNEKVKFFSSKLGIPFICWCGKYRKLSVKTVESYISAIKKISSLNGSRLKEVFDSNLEKTLLSGLENKRKPQVKEKEKIEPVTLGMLSKIKQKLRKAEWPELT